jgi:hypothetical protein
MRTRLYASPRSGSRTIVGIRLPAIVLTFVLLLAGVARKVSGRDWDQQFATEEVFALVERYEARARSPSPLRDA